VGLSFRCSAFETLSGWCQKLGKKGEQDIAMRYIYVYGKSARNAREEDAAVTSEPEDTRGLLLAAVSAAGI